MPMDNQGNPRSGFGRARFANEAHTQGPANKKPPKPDASGGGEKPAGEEHMHAHSHKGGEHDVSKMDIGAVVEKHGPATHVMSEHGEDTHHVHTVHGEKHHHSDHESHEAAHDHMGKAMGVGMDEGEGEEYGEEESPDEDGMEQGSPKHAWMS